MTRKVIMLFLLFLFIEAPCSALADDIETIFSADQVLIQPDNILLAKGNVKVRRGEVVIESEEMIVDENADKIEFKGIKEFFDGNSIKMEAKQAVLSSDFSEGIFSAAQILIENTIKIRARKIELKDNKINNVQEIDRVTSCEDCKDGVPLWHFTASTAINDAENQNIIYRDVTLNVAGYTVGYIPFLRLPNPKVDRARGFLVPELNISSNLGVGVKLPYFVPIGESRDLLITPFISPRTKSTEYRYRQKFKTGDFKLTGAFSSDDLTDDVLRGFYKAEGNFGLKYGFKLNMTGGNVNHDTYLADYGFGSKTDLNAEVSLEKVLVDNKRSFNTKLGYIREETDDVTIVEYYSLEGNYFAHINQTLLPGRVAFDIAGKSALSVLAGNQVSRPPSSFVVGIQHTNNRNIGSVQILDHTFARLASFVNSTNDNSFDEEINLQYGISSKFTYPVMRINRNVMQVISPSVMISFNGQEGRTEGDFFIGSDELNFGNLFSGKKHASLSETELGMSISASIDYSINWSNEQNLDFSIGSLWLENATYNQNDYRGLEPQKESFLAGFEYKSNDRFFVSGKALINDQGEIFNGQLDSDLKLKGISFDTSYEFVDVAYDERLMENIEYFSIATSYTGYEEIYFTAAGRYDLSRKSLADSSSLVGVGFASGLWDYKVSQTYERKGPITTRLAAVYNDDCTRVSLSLENKNRVLGSSESIQTLSLLFNLKPFASFSLPGV